jgi:hypothetical protein
LAAGGLLILPSYSTGLQIKSTGAAVDGGRDCTLRHRMPAADPRGKITIETGPYTPGLTQEIRATVTHPEGVAGRHVPAVIRIAGAQTQAGVTIPVKR